MFLFSFFGGSLLLISRRRRSAAAESACRGSERVLVAVQVAFLGLGVEGGAGRQAVRQQTLVVERTNERARFSSSLYGFFLEKSLDRACCIVGSARKLRAGHLDFLCPFSGAGEPTFGLDSWRTFRNPEGDCEMNLEGRGMEALMAISSS